MLHAIPQATVKGVQALKSQAAVFERYRGFDRCMRRLHLSADQPVPSALLAELYAYWGDPLTQGAETYLRSCLAEAARAQGPILQCGASLLTVVLGRLCTQGDEKPRQLWCLEHDDHWSNVVRSWLTQYRVSAAHIIVSQPRLFNQYVWYAVDPGRLAKDISLVLCEGARATPRGVIGTLQRVGGRLAPAFCVLARGVNRAEELRHLALWAKTHDAACVVVDRQAGFVKISRRPGDTAALP